jgi:ATP-dependent phosphoenolpyruvate carboxykinase
MKPEHQWSPDPTVKENTITETGALCISSGSKTGRVPKEKRIVYDATTKDVSPPVKSAQKSFSGP